MAVYLYNNEEIKKIAQSCQITANILDEIELIIDEGITTKDIDSEARKLCSKYGVKPAFLGYQGYPAAICTSINEVVVHGIPAKRKLLNGDIVGIDFGVYSEGYYGDSARTYIIGKVDDKIKQLVEVTKTSLYKGIKKAVAGNRISDISNEIEEYVKQFGFVPVRNFTGHGIGENLHEEPSVPNYGKPGKGPRIQDGMVFAIEPMINTGTYKVDVLADDWTAVTKDGGFSAHFEHTIAIIDGKAEILTKGKNFC
ncbi:MAG: type I methionyl aminopeptidase [Spirochaetes bacterium]|nr:type I methionyl aminopeptidase [Spirochaetota bacterium]